MANGLRDEMIRRDVIEAMRSGGPPLVAYKKTILGRVAIKYLDPIRLMPEELVLTGNPSNPDEEETWSFKVWSKEEDTYFHMQNKLHLRRGTLVPYTYTEQVDVSVNQISDEEIELILQKPFFALKNKLEEFTSTVPVRRFLLMAEKMNRPIGTVNYIKQVLEEMETGKNSGEATTVIQMDYIPNE